MGRVMGDGRFAHFAYGREGFCGCGNSTTIHTHIHNPHSHDIASPSRQAWLGLAHICVKAQACPSEEAQGRADERARRVGRKEEERKKTKTRRRSKYGVGR